MPERLTIYRAQLEEVFSHLEVARPFEACGLLAGDGDRVRRVYAVANAERSPVRYLMEPGEQLRAMLDMEAHGWELIGIYHSHPTGPLAPSGTDLAEAYYPESAYVICAPDEGGRWRARAFDLSDGGAREVPLRIVDDPDPGPGE